MSEQKHSFLQSAVFPLLYVLAMWVVFYYDQHYILNLASLGLEPRSFSGLLGILTMPLLHGDISHIVSNTFPLLILGTLLFYHYPELARKVIVISVLSSGFLVWLFGKAGSIHIGASGLLYALAGFLFFSGILRKNKMLFGVTLLITFLYGTIIWGVFPPDIQQAFHIVVEHRNISWEGHLFGFLSGVALAFIYRKVGLQEPIYQWQKEDDDELSDTDPYWMVDEEKPAAEEQKEDLLKNTSDNPYTVTYTFIPKKDENKTPS